MTVGRPVIGIGTFVVVPQALRGQGCGTRVVQALIETAQQHPDGLTILMISCVLTLAPFYTRAGQFKLLDPLLLDDSATMTAEEPVYWMFRSLQQADSPSDLCLC
jgi:predicted GNAT family N-acyltransferase